MPGTGSLFPDAQIRSLSLTSHVSGFRHALAAFPALKKLPRRKKLALAEELWLAGIDDSMPVSHAHKTLLDGRWKAYRAGKAKRITLKELERRLVGG